IARKIKKDGGKYFDPYTNVIAERETKKLLDRIYPLRKCSNPQGRNCLYYLMGNCLACSTETVTKSIYEEIIADISKFLHSGYKEIKQDLKEKMNIASEKLNFERAKELRDQIASIDAVMERQKVTLNEKTDIDIFGYSYNK